MTTIPSASDRPPIEVEFSLSSPGAGAVSVALFFNQWSVEMPFSIPTNSDEASREDHLMVRALVDLEQVMPGRWRCVTPLFPGWYEYLFVVDGAWVMDPEASEVCPDGAGGFNAARMVESRVASNRISRLATVSGSRDHVRVDDHRTDDAQSDDEASIQAS